MIADALLTRDEIAALIPHSGAMCLLDSVLAWDSTSICCCTGRHRAPDNPLRHAGRLGAMSGIEFAAQAMALHGRLSGAISARPRLGLLISLRQVECRCARLDDVREDLLVEATREMGDEDRVAYSFALSAGAEALLRGRATVLLSIETKP
jgi:predicted hotdog family 3-hydroxylacyl-ACP dehydratase